MAISALARTRNRSDYAWLDAYRPLERIGKSIDLYYIPRRGRQALAPVAARSREMRTSGGGCE